MNDHDTTCDATDFNWVTLDMLPPGSTSDDLAEFRGRAEVAASWDESLSDARCHHIRLRELVDELLSGPTLNAAWRRVLTTYVKDKSGYDLATITPEDLAALCCDCWPASMADMLHVLDGLTLQVARITDQGGREGIYAAHWGADIDCGYGAHSVDCDAGQAFRECLETIDPPAQGEWSERVHMTYARPFIVRCDDHWEVAYALREKSVTRHPQLPSCSGNHEHDWQEIECCGSGSGIYLREICPQCKTVQSYDSAHEDPQTGETFTAYRWEEAAHPDCDLYDELIEEEEITSETGKRWIILRLVHCQVDGIHWYAIREECHDDRSYEDFQLAFGDEQSESRARAAFRDFVGMAWGKYKYRD